MIDDRPVEDMEMVEVRRQKLRRPTRRVDLAVVLAVAAVLDVAILAALHSLGV